MIYLFAASLVWALSFGLMKHKLIGAGLPPDFVAMVRLCLSLALFAPLIRLRAIGPRVAVQLVLLGAVQYGAMYVCYSRAFGFLAAHQVALFTTLTPVFVTLFHDVERRRFHGVVFLTAVLAVLGAAVVLGGELDVRVRVIGVLVLQVSNACFAFGQVRYRRIMSSFDGVRDRDVFGLLYLGGALTAVAAAACAGIDWSHLHVSGGQALTLLYLGLVPSGIGFFLWNVGARRSRAGTLAVFNNAKIPLAVVCSLALFGESAPLGRLLVGGAVMVAAVLVNERLASSPDASRRG